MKPRDQVKVLTLVSCIILLFLIEITAIGMFTGTERELFLVGMVLFIALGISLSFIIDIVFNAIERKRIS